MRVCFLGELARAHAANPELPLLIADDDFDGSMLAVLPSWRRIVSLAALHGVPPPVFSSSLSHYDGVRSERLPAALIQGQRDFFGAHTYRRIHAEGSWHMLWAAESCEEVASC